MLIGAHLSTTKGLNSLQDQMNSQNMNTCAFFLKNNRRFQSKPYLKQEVDNFLKDVKNIENLVPHGSYLINLANDSQKSLDCLKDDLFRCKQLNIKYYNVHPGSNTQNLENPYETVGRRIVNVLKSHVEVFEEDKRVKFSCTVGSKSSVKLVDGTTILIENMAGQGRTLCFKFSQLNEIIQYVKLNSDKENSDREIGVCLDTAHAFGAGYDLKNDYDKVMRQFEDEVDLKYLKAVHLNDSKVELGSRKDRHECIGEGYSGIDVFKRIMNDVRFEKIPLILETPKPEKYKEEVEMLKSFRN